MTIWIISGVRIFWIEAIPFKMVWGGGRPKPLKMRRGVASRKNEMSWGGGWVSEKISMLGGGGDHIDNFLL